MPAPHGGRRSIRRSPTAGGRTWSRYPLRHSSGSFLRKQRSVCFVLSLGISATDFVPFPPAIAESSPKSTSQLSGVLLATLLLGSIVALSSSPTSTTSTSDSSATLTGKWWRCSRSSGTARSSVLKACSRRLRARWCLSGSPSLDPLALHLQTDRLSIPRVALGHRPSLPAGLSLPSFTRRI